MKIPAILVAIAATLTGHTALAQAAPPDSGMEIRTKKARSGSTVMDMVATPTLKHNLKRKCIGTYQTGQTPVAYFDDPKNARLRYMLTRRNGDEWSLWIGVRQGSQGECYALYMAGTQLTLSDYIQDENQDSSKAYYWNRTATDPKAKCAKLAKEVSARQKTSVGCFPFQEYYDAMRSGGNRKDIAFTAMIQTPGGPYILYGFVGETRELLLAQTDRDGATISLLMGRNFGFTVGTSSTVFAKRRAAEDAERQARAAEQRRLQQARAQRRAQQRALAEERRLAQLRAARAKETLLQRRFLDFMDGVVAADSQSWYVNKYRRGTMHNLRGRPDPRYPKTDVYLTADYYYETGMRGTVTFHMINGRVFCIDYLDDSCRKPRVGPNGLKVGLAVAVLVGLAAASQSGR